MTTLTRSPDLRSERWWESQRARTLLIAVPIIGWVALWMGGGYVMLFVQAFWSTDGLNITPGFSLDAFSTAFTSTLYLPVMLRSIGVGLTVALITTAIAFPVAYFITFRLRAAKMLVYMLVIVPMWSSYLVRAYAWKIILGEHGVVNEALLSLGIIRSPLELLYTPAAVIITLVSIFTPFMILTIYTTLERIPVALIEASQDLGETPLATFRRVVLPLALPGVVAGSIFTLGLAGGDFLAPSLVGAPENIMIANLIQSQFGATFNWPLGSALAMTLLVIIFALISAASAAEKRETI
ncbi:ABC transporter permease [Pseudarthrobacter sp. NKDBFgelt]|uniref:ABC transporter permease n=1 Tax=Pseudarthrobacter sp. NKDBFgelt TaxID=3384443 RepID=UPI0038D4D568